MSIMSKLRRKTEESPSDVVIKQAGNGYIVIRQEKLERPRKAHPMMQMFGSDEIDQEAREYVFTSLAEVAEFLSDHYSDPLVKV